MRETKQFRKLAKWQGVLVDGHIGSDPVVSTPRANKAPHNEDNIGYYFDSKS